MNDRAVWACSNKQSTDSPLQPSGIPLWQIGGTLHQRAPSLESHAAISNTLQRLHLPLRNHQQWLFHGQVNHAYLPQHRLGLAALATTV